MHRQDLPAEPEVKNIFLTGEVGVGKSTVLEKALARCSPLVVGGFRTVSLPKDRGAAVHRVYLAPAWECAQHDDAHLVGIRIKGEGRRIFPQVFEEEGVHILCNPPKYAQIVVMDEIGDMESEAPCFCRAVIEALKGPIPVLGVVKPKNAPLPNAVRGQKNTVVLRVTRENRADVAETVWRFLAPHIK